MKPRLADKIALVTGGAQGMGEAIVRKFVEHGASVVIGDIKADKGSTLAAELGTAAAFQPLDVRRAEDWEAAVSATTGRFGGLDILVNNAGAGASAPIEEESPEDHRRLIDLNLTSVWLGMRAVGAAMGRQGGGSIVNISSIAGMAGTAGMASYVAAKFGVRGMTQALALEFADRRIRVNSVHPGIIETPMVQAAPPATIERLHQAVSWQPIPRLGRPEEVANAVLFFASDESSYCTGTSLLVDGGQLAGPYRERG
jgi:3alpha(or 20beta)-hydroxysteroid dehydrogenase